jgi:hypothetical protein
MAIAEEERREATGSPEQKGKSGRPNFLVFYLETPASSDEAAGRKV